jgi:WD40 repeat protein
MLDVSKARILHDFTHDRPLLACRYDPKERFVVTSSEDFKLQKFNLPGGEKTILPEVHNSWVHALGFSPDGNVLFSGGCDGKLVWWGIAEAEVKPIRTIEAHQGWLRTLAVSPDGKLVATGGNDRLVKVWNAETGELVKQWSSHAKNVYSLTFMADNKRILSGDLGGVIQLHQIDSDDVGATFDGKPLHTYEGGQMVDFGGVRCLAVRGAGDQLAAGGLHKATNPLGAVHEPLALRFAFEGSKLLRSHVTEGIPGGGLWRVQWLSDGTLIGVSGGSSGGFLLFWNDQQDKDFFRFKLPALARDMDVAATGLNVVTSHHDGHVRITRLSAT